MRKLLVLSVVLAALAFACENKNPAGPNGAAGGSGSVTVTKTTSSTTTTTSILPTTTTTSTSTSTTTTTVVGNAQRRYAAFPPAAANLPSDMTLFFVVLPGESAYTVTGVWVAPNGVTGAVSGELGDAANPLELGGTFQGVLTAKVGTCTAERYYEGPLTPSSLTWTGGATHKDCTGSPLSFNKLTLLRSDGAGLPTTVPPTPRPTP